MPTATISRSIRLAQIHDALTALDEIIALAAKTSEVSQIASLEVNSRRLLQSTWRTLSREATANASALVQSGANEEVVVNEIDQRMVKWAEIVGPRFAANSTRIYQLARVAGRKRAKGTIDRPLVYDTTVAKDEPGSIVVVVQLPAAIAAQFPKDRGGDDSSPPHFTALYIAAGRERYLEAVEVVRKVVASFEPFRMELAKGVAWFRSDSKEITEGERWIAHKAVALGAAHLETLHWALAAAFRKAGFEPSVRDSFKAHATLAYCPAEGAYEGPVPEGGFDATDVVVWGGKTQSMRIKLGTTKRFVQKAPSAEVVGAFDTVDEEAIAVLKRNNLFWISDYYEKNVSTAIRKTVREVMLTQGQDRARAAVELKAALMKRFGEVSAPSGWHGTQNAYFESLAANAATTARAQGQLRSFAKAGFTSYEIVNPMDERTCPTCQHLDGKIFTTVEGARLADSVVKAKTPDDVRSIHPWLGTETMKALSPTPGKGPRAESRALSEVGFSLPPFHFRCRCAVDVTEESASDES